LPLTLLSLVLNDHGCILKQVNRVELSGPSSWKGRAKRCDSPAVISWLVKVVVHIWHVNGIKIKSPILCKVFVCIDWLCLVLPNIDNFWPTRPSGREFRSFSNHVYRNGCWYSQASKTCSWRIYWHGSVSHPIWTPPFLRFLPVTPYTQVCFLLIN